MIDQLTKKKVFSKKIVREVFFWQTCKIYKSMINEKIFKLNICKNIGNHKFSDAISNQTIYIGLNFDKLILIVQKYLYFLNHEKTIYRKLNRMYLTTLFASFVIV